MKIKKNAAVKKADQRLMQELKNSSFYKQNGVNIDITTLTGIKTKVTEQKFYTLGEGLTPSSFVPVAVGENAWSDEILTYRQFDVGTDFETGLIDSGSGTGKMETMETEIDGVKVKVKDWGKKVVYNLIELNKASRAGNWSLIEAKESARFRNWQLGIQKIAFLGIEGNADVNGLLTQTDVTVNTAVITKFIKDMNATEFQAFIGGIMPAYFNNSNNTALPNMFVIPTDDYLGLANSTDESFPLKSRLERMEEAFKAVTMNANFKILPLAYANKARNALGVNRYTLYRYDEETLRMDIPVDYTTTTTDTINGFQYNSVAYGEFTGLKAYRPAEVIYFDHSV
jgi:hypothetical protein